MTAVKSSGTKVRAVSRIKKIVSIVQETSPPVTTVNNGYIRIVDSTTAYAAFFLDDTGIEQYMITDYMGQWTIEQIDFFDNLLLENGDYVLFEDASRVLMENNI